MCEDGEIVIAHGRVIARRNDQVSEINGLTEGTQELLLELNGTGIAEDDLLTLATERNSVAGLAALFFAIHQIARQGFLQCCALGEREPLLTVSGTAPQIVIGQRLPDEATKYVFSRFALIRCEENKILLESAASGARAVIHDPRVLTVVAHFAASSHFGDLAGPASGLSMEETSVLRSLLLRCGILVEPGREEQESLAYWNIHDLLFHARSRYGRHLGSYGGTYPFRGRFEPLPATKSAMSEETVDLYRPDLEQRRLDDPSFTEVLERRHTTRTFGDPPISLRQLSEFLYRAARHRRTFVDDNGQPLGSRPYPGGGGIYELEIYLSVASCLGLPRGFYHYDACEHRLSRIPARSGIVDALLERAAGSSGSNPQVLLTIAARFGRMFWKYESMGYAVILKDVGVLYQTMYLVAEAIGLGACALGAGDAELLCDAAGLDYYAESAVGEFLIGSRALLPDLPAG